MKKILLCMMISLATLNVFAELTLLSTVGITYSNDSQAWLKAEAIREEAVEHLSTNGEMEQSELMKDFLKRAKSLKELKGLSDLEILEKLLSEDK
jgi:hypothetical protein